MATPAFRAAGTAVFTSNNVSNPTSLTPTKSGSTVNGDLMVLITESRSITATVGTPTGWTIVSGFPKRSATASGGSFYAFVRTADGGANDAPTVTWTGLTTGTNGDSSGARIISYSGTSATADGTPPAANDASSTTSITIPAHTTLLNNSMVFGAAMRVNDTAHTFTTATFTERTDDHTTSGTGHGTTTSSKLQVTAGSSGTATVTPSNTTASRTLAISFGFKQDISSIAVALVTETDVMFAMGKQKRKEIALISQTATVFPLGKTKSRTLSLITETDVVNPLGRTKNKAVAQVTETDVVFAITPQEGGTNVALNLVTETDEVLAMARLKSRTLAQLTETDIVNPLTVTKSKAIALVTETDTVFPLRASKGRILTQIVETDLVNDMLVRKTRETAFVIETDLVFGLTASKSRNLALITETDTLFALSAKKYANLALVTETDQVFRMSITGGTPPPRKFRYDIASGSWAYVPNSIIEVLL